MKISETFKSKYMKSEDVKRDGQTQIITAVSLEDTAGNGQQRDFKPVLYFEGCDVGLVLNKVNGMMTAALYGDETDDWIGRPFVMRLEKVLFNGKIVDGIRVVPGSKKMLAAASKDD